MYAHTYQPIDEKPIIAAKDAIELLYTESKGGDINQLRTQALIAEPGSDRQKAAFAQMTQLSIMESLAWQNLMGSKSYDKNNLLDYAQSLVNEYQRVKKLAAPKDKENILLQNALASATWAYVRIAAIAAIHQDKATFDLARKQMKALTDRKFHHNSTVKTISQALRHSDTHNDLPTLALAFMYKASVDIFNSSKFDESDLTRFENLEKAYKECYLKLHQQIAETEKRLGTFKESDAGYAQLRQRLITLKAESMLAGPVCIKANYLRREKYNVDSLRSGMHRVDVDVRARPKMGR